ncbi:unnamed protein product [Polarella glacialis]|uniref:SPRY domain-containing protein n=1 Tax=Polarella glacialis TaxID=89957 RepID=A0A813H691_POLGL|nr:unnamed protein product [Polarella glacialis]CAE8684765.1 unnamed protein product [Polarella glacialis]
MAAKRNWSWKATAREGHSQGMPRNNNKNNNNNNNNNRATLGHGALGLASRLDDEQPPSVAAATARLEEEKEEADAPMDNSEKVEPGSVKFNFADRTLNAMSLAGGKMLMPLTDGGMQYLLAGVRANAGVKAGRCMFEARIFEHVHLAPEMPGDKAPHPRQLVRVGFSLMGSSLFVGDGACSCGFDSEGFFLQDKSRKKVASKFMRGQTVAVLVNLDVSSPNHNTVSLFVDGTRASPPMPLPKQLLGKPLFPTVTYKNVSLEVNFGPMAQVPLPFVCNMLGGAAMTDIEWCHCEGDKPQVVFPVGLPKQGYFDWVDEFVEKNPGYTELSDRKIIEWASKSGIYCRIGNGGSKDKPEAKFGVRALDDWSVRKVIRSLAASASGNFIVAELKSNLVPAERQAVLQRFSSHDFHRRAVVVMGEPGKDFKERMHSALLADKKAVVPDIADLELTKSYANFAIPSLAEGFDAVSFAWQPEATCSKLLKAWVRQKKLVLHAEDLQPGESFKESWAVWQKNLAEWHKCYADCHQAWQVTEMDRDSPGVFTIEDIMDIGNGEPLFANFADEDWTLLNTRYELHLLLHSFKKDLSDADRPSFELKHLSYYYNRYYKKRWDLEQFGVNEFDDLLDLLEHSVSLNSANGHLKANQAENVPLESFVKLTEDSRRQRQRRIKDGDQTGRLNFPPITPAEKGDKCYGKGGDGKSGNDTAPYGKGARPPPFPPPSNCVVFPPCPFMVPVSKNAPQLEPRHVPPPPCQSVVSNDTPPFEPRHVPPPPRHSVVSPPPPQSVLSNKAPPPEPRHVPPPPRQSALSNKAPPPEPRHVPPPPRQSQSMLSNDAPLRAPRHVPPPQCHSVSAPQGNSGTTYVAQKFVTQCTDEVTIPKYRPAQKRANSTVPALEAAANGPSKQPRTGGYGEV